MMLRRKSCIWPVVAVALWTGCAVGRLGYYPAVSPVRAAVDYQGLGGFPAEGGAGDLAPVRLLSLSDAEIETLWGELAVESPGLADQSAGIEGEFKGWVWCARCQSNQKHPHSCTGTGTWQGGGRGGAGELTVKQALALALSSLLCLFLIVDAMGAFDTTY